VANIKSQIKRIRTNEKAQLRNKSARSAIKTAIRRFRDALDVAVSSGVLHANAAANRKSAMAKQANKAGTL
jgi:small subunit ribosomal protein S20